MSHALRRVLGGAAHRTAQEPTRRERPGADSRTYRPLREDMSVKSCPFRPRGRGPVQSRQHLPHGQAS
jgi:hypothetical protein